MSHILAVGIASLDVINLVASYPGEDSEVRAVAHRVARGGNAANALSVLVQAGHRCDFAGVLALEPDGRRIEEDLVYRGIGTNYCRRVADGKAPTSYITLSRQTGSRTIIHYRDLPEYDYLSFDEIPVQEFDWLHFEGRNVAEVERMLRRSVALRVDQPVSLEVEKEREGIEGLLPLADIIFFSRPFARGRGYHGPAEFLRAMRVLAPSAILVCTWGELGACAVDHEDRFMESPAFPPQEIEDTVGAGDTFIAGFVDAMASGRTIQEALAAGCRLAGRKVGQRGFDGLFDQRGG